jgi:hypothetical protein
VSIRAEGAWALTRGSPEVTVAIIDDSFDLSKLSVNARVEVVSVPSVVKASASGSHGTRLAELILGSRSGYPGVAPECRLLAIVLPSVCTDAEEAAAFDLAFKRNASVVCCGWGPPFDAADTRWTISPLVSASIARLARESRNGRGALVCFAVGNDGADLDGYASHPAVVAVAGVTASGEQPQPMDRGEAIAFAAPVSSEAGSIGGRCCIPAGTSGAVALAAGVAALVFSVNPGLTAGQVAGILQGTAAPLSRAPHWSGRESQGANGPPKGTRLIDVRYGVLNAGAAVTLARHATPDRVAHGTLSPSIRSTFSSRQIASTNKLRFRSRRFIGGEHSVLGMIGAEALKRQYVQASHDLYRAFFEGMFADFTPADLNPIFEDYVQPLVDEFFFQSTRWPTIQAPAFAEGWIIYGFLLGLAADLYGSPIDLSKDLAHEVLPKFVGIFRREIDKEFSLHSDSDIFWISFLPLPEFLGGDHSHFIRLAKRNYSHFAGDNLLFYLAHHLLAIDSAMRCATAGNAADARTYFTSALLSEGFAGHFLTDMFSAGHARVPRYAFLHKIYSSNDVLADIISKLLHDHEGRLGVFLTNARGQLWYAYGDGRILNAHGVRDKNQNLDPWFNEMEPLGLGGLLDTVIPPMQLHPYYLAANLVFVSLADVLRHMATGVSAADSALPVQTKGLLGYILDRLPFALRAADVSALRTSLGDKFQEQGRSLIENITMAERLQSVDVPELWRTYQSISPVVTRGYTYIFEAEFRLLFWQQALGTERATAWANAQRDHLKTNLIDQPNSPKLLQAVPQIVRGYHNFPSTIVTPYELPNITVPESWKRAIPPSLIHALTDPGGVWE